MLLPPIAGIDTAVRILRSMPSTIAPIAGIDTVRVCLRVRNVPIAPPLRGLILIHVRINVSFFAIAPHCGD